MRLLVYTPAYAGGPLAECRGSVLGQRYDDRWEWVVDDDDPFPTPDHRNVLAKYQRARAKALAEGFDALVTVEHDMVLPVDALEKLAATEAPVVFGTYTLRHGSHVLNTWRYENRRNFGMSLSLYPHELRILRRAGVDESEPVPARAAHSAAGGGGQGVGRRLGLHADPAGCVGAGALCG